MKKTKSENSKAKRLAVHADTVRFLTGDELDGVIGGICKTGSCTNTRPSLDC